MSDNKSQSSCEIYKYIKSIKGLASNSTSPSDTMIVSFKDRIMFDKQPVEQAFMKIFITSLVDEKGKTIEIDYKKKRSALIYEQKVYDIIRWCIRFNYCPYFVKLYDNGFNCSLKNFYNIIKHQSNVNDEKIKMLMIRSIYHMISQASNRPSITDLTELKNYTLSEFMRKKYNDIFDEYGRLLMNIKVDKKLIGRLIENWQKINKNLLIDKHANFNFIITEYINGKTILDIQKFYTEWQFKEKNFTS